MQKKQKTRKIGSIVAVVIVILAVVVIIALCLSLLLRDHEEVVTKTQPTESLHAVVCEAEGTLEDEFFSPTGATDIDHTIKITYHTDDAEEINYTYEAEYPTPQMATEAEATLHAQYNKYMQTMADELSPSFSLVDDDLKINFFVKAYDLTSGLAKMVFINKDEFDQMSGFAVADLVKIYQNKGFSCEYKN